MSVNNLTTLTGLGVIGLTIPDWCKVLHLLTDATVKSYTTLPRLTVNAILNMKMLISHIMVSDYCVCACESNLYTGPLTA